MGYYLFFTGGTPCNDKIEGAKENYGMGWKIMERRYKCANGVVEKTQYAVGANAAARGKKKKGNTTFRKQEANFNGAIRKGARILNCNYSAEGGYFIGLDYDQAGLRKLLAKAEVAEADYMAMMGTSLDEPELQAEAILQKIHKAAEHELRLWLRRARRAFGEVKIFGVTAELDGETGEVVRVHHHVCLQLAETCSRMEIMEKAQKLWKHGGTDVRTLRAMPDYTPTAVYMLRQVIHRENENKYIVSRGMEQPEISEREVLGANEIRVPPGANVLERAKYSDDSFAQYVRYIPKKREYRRREPDLQCG